MHFDSPLLWLNYTHGKPRRRGFYRFSRGIFAYVARGKTDSPTTAVATCTSAFAYLYVICRIRISGDAAKPCGSETRALLYIIHLSACADTECALFRIAAFDRSYNARMSAYELTPARAPGDISTQVSCAVAVWGENYFSHLFP